MRFAWVAVLAGCWTASSPPPPITNKTPTPPPAGPPHIEGIVSDETNEALAGVTVVADGSEDTVAITDEHGAYKITLTEGKHRVSFYYLDLTVERDVVVKGTTTVDQRVDQRWAGTGTPMHCVSAEPTSCRPKQ